MRMSEKQVLSIRDADARINIWEGAVRSGKSFASLYRFLHFLRFGPDGPLIIVGRTTRTITTNIIDPMREILGDYVKYWIGKGELNIFNRKIYVVSANDARAEAKIRGSTYVGAYMDEITLIPESFFKMLMSRLSLPGAKFFGTTNPDSPYHWLKRDFLDRSDMINLRSWRFKLEDNPSLGQEYLTAIKSEYSGLWYQRFIEGRWVQAEGAIYDFFDMDIHCIDYPDNPATFYIAGVDYGTSNPFACVLLGINFDYFPNMWVEDEYYFNSKIAQRQKTDYEYAEDVSKFLQGRPVKAIYVDPSALSFKLEMQKRASGDQRGHLSLDLFDAKNEVNDGIRLVSQYLTQGTLKVSKKCKNLIAEFQSYVWDSKGTTRGFDKPLKENDHALDALRYALYSHFFGADDWGDGMNRPRGPMSPGDLDRLYRQSVGTGQELPRFFQDPQGNTPWPV